jgi:hypothetical protein
MHHLDPVQVYGTRVTRSLGFPPLLSELRSGMISAVSPGAPPKRSSAEVESPSGHWQLDGRNSRSVKCGNIGRIGLLRCRLRHAIGLRIGRNGCDLAERPSIVTLNPAFRLECA